MFVLCCAQMCIHTQCLVLWYAPVSSALCTAMASAMQFWPQPCVWVFQALETLVPRHSCVLLSLNPAFISNAAPNRVAHLCEKCAG